MLWLPFRFGLLFERPWLIWITQTKQKRTTNVSLAILPEWLAPVVIIIISVQAFYVNATSFSHETAKIFLH